MNIDIAALRAIEADKGISIETVISTIQTALLTAYRHTEGISSTPGSTSTPRAASCG